eukprot:12420594-Karenia_brevis.AAC.1
MSIAELQALVQQCRSGGFPNEAAETQLEERKRSEQPRTLEAVRAEVRKAEAAFERALNHAERMQAQHDEAQVKLQTVAERLAEARHEECKAVEREHQEK